MVLLPTVESAVDDDQDDDAPLLLSSDDADDDDTNLVVVSNEVFVRRYCPSILRTSTVLTSLSLQALLPTAVSFGGKKGDNNNDDDGDEDDGIEVSLRFEIRW